MGKKNKYKTEEPKKGPAPQQAPQQPASSGQQQPGTSATGQQAQRGGAQQQPQPQGQRPQQQQQQQRPQQQQQQGQQRPQQQQQQRPQKQQQGGWSNTGPGGSQQGQAQGATQQRGPPQGQGDQQPQSARQSHGGSQQGGPPQGQGGQQQREQWQSRGQGGQQQQGPRQGQGAPQQRGQWQGHGQGGQHHQGQGQGGQQQREQWQSRGQGGQQQQGPRQGQGAPQQRGQWQGHGQGGQQQQGQGQGGQQQREQWQSRGQGGQQQQGPRQGQGAPQQRGQWQGHGQGGQQQHGGPQQGQRGQGDRGAGPSAPHQQMRQLSISNEPTLPTMKESCAGVVRGTIGSPGQVEVNYLKLDLSAMPNELYHYDVTITPDRPKKFLRPAFEQCNRESFPDIVAAFDGSKNCYAFKRLPTPISITVTLADFRKECKVEIKETTDCVVDMDSLRTYQNGALSDKPMRAMQALDVILSANNHERGVRVGRSYFRQPDNPYDLSGGYEAWTGLFQSAILGEQPYLNVDISHKSFPKRNTALKFLEESGINVNQTLERRDLRLAEDFFKGISIEYHPPESFGAMIKNYKVLGIGDSASRIKFKNDEGVEMTIESYFQSKGYRLQYPRLNCIKVGSSVRSIYLPMELCRIPAGQALNRKDGSKQVANMIKFAATSTNVRKAKIMDILSYFDLNSCQVVRASGIQIGQNFIKVPMRILPGPCLEYLNSKTVTSFRGAWNMENQCFFKPANIPKEHKWAILYEENKRGFFGYSDLETFRESVFRAGQYNGLTLSKNAEICTYDRNSLRSELQRLANAGAVLVFVVLSNFGTSYAEVKQMAELKVGITTQCIKEDTIKRKSRDRTLFTNIFLKVNAKLNGTNHKVSHGSNSQIKALMGPMKKVMFLGADVTHPSPDQRHIPSVVGTVASHDLGGTCYNMQYRLQQSSKSAALEVIEDMESITLYHLQQFKKYQNCYPDQVIYYRDGVSDGQFNIIRNNELRNIRSAFKKLNINVKLTCIIVVKRHHTRFFPMTQPRDGRDFNNVEPGTIVDQHIVHPNEMQFFLVSHQSIQGTARPTRYNVIVDDSKFDINFLQKLTFDLCHLFPRCNRVVSYPTPAYLSHLVAARGRSYIEGIYKFSKNLNQDYENRLVSRKLMDNNPMYFV